MPAFSFVLSRACSPTPSWNNCIEQRRQQIPTVVQIPLNTNLCLKINKKMYFQVNLMPLFFFFFLFWTSTPRIKNSQQRKLYSCKTWATWSEVLSSIVRLDMHSPFPGFVHPLQREGPPCCTQRPGCLGWSHNFKDQQHRICQLAWPFKQMSTETKAHQGKVVTECHTGKIMQICINDQLSFNWA